MVLDARRLILVARYLVMQIVNICVDVLTEEKEDGGKRLKEGLAQLCSGKMPPMFVFICASTHLKQLGCEFDLTIPVLLAST